MSLVFVCIPTPTLGGAEKRFVGLWRYLCQEGLFDARLVVQRSLFEVLARTPEFAPLPQAVELFDVPSGESARSAMRETLRRLHTRNPKAVFHFVMVTPFEVQRFASRRTVFSEAVASLNLFNWKGRLASRLGALASSRVDALEEEVVADFSRFLPFKRGSITHTPNSFVDLEYYRPAEKPANRLTFTGLFSDAKQAFRLARAVPVIDRRLRENGVQTPEFWFLGRETRSPGIQDLFNSFGSAVNAKTAFVADPRPILAESKVIFSVQELTNYPSKALLEGMACGALPVVTDVGKTRKMVTEAFGEFVPCHFTDSQIAEKCVAIMTMSEGVRMARAAQMRRHLEEHFSVHTMAAYYADIYRSLGDRGER